MPVSKQQSTSSHTAERVAAFIFGVVFVLILLFVVIFLKEPTEFQKNIITIVLALAGAGIGAMLPGSLNVNASGIVKAGGAIAVFVIIYFFSPASLVIPQKTDTRENVPTIKETGKPQIEEKTNEPISKERYNELVTEFYKLTSKFNEIDTSPALSLDVKNKSKALLEEIQKLDTEKEGYGIRIEKSYIITSLYYMLASLQEESKERKILASQCIQYSKDNLLQIQKLQDLAKNGDENSKKVYQWLLEENIKERSIYFYALSLAIQKLAGENIEIKDIQKQMEKIPSENRDLYNLDSHPLLVAALQTKEKVPPLPEVPEETKTNTKEPGEEQKQ
ncbi:MAG: hypothetical protein H7A25_07095 [Leptospiraceae bacterium]|nr:hypothetical protein [Leptospiraceae bacterium]MCP5499649.1 hypothetical protein [Leptospiraceae bacterium]